MNADRTDRGRILVVDDDAAVCWAVERALSAAGYQVVVAADATAGLRELRRERPDLVLTDVRMPGMSGLEFLGRVQERHPLLPVVVMTAFGSVDVAVEAVRAGAVDYLAKPLDLDRLEEVVALAVDAGAIAVRVEPQAGEDAMVMIGDSPAMHEVYRRIALAADTDIGVLITGETGSGKELVARALHRHSSRRSGPFLAINCGAMPDHLVESELFGHEAGAFTDARQRAIGRLEAANGGTVLLDEVGELPLSAQIKLLRFLEDHRFTRVGGSEELQADVRVIAATHRNIDSMVAAGAFREDLSFRLRVMVIAVPPLRERSEDIPALVRHLLGRIAVRLDRGLAITQRAMDRLQSATWPGNVRELKHVLEEAAVLASGGVIAPEHLRIEAFEAHPGASLEAAVARTFQQLLAQAGSIHQTVFERVERVLVEQALAHCQGNQLRAAELLGINRVTLKRRMDQYAP